MPGLFDDDDYEGDEVAEYYRERDGPPLMGWPFRRRRRGLRPGMFGFKPISLLMGVMFIAIGISFIAQAIATYEDTGSVMGFVMGPIMIIFGLIFPIWGWKEDARVRSEIAGRKQWQTDRNRAFEEQLAAGRVSPFDERIAAAKEKGRWKGFEEDDPEKVWIPGKTRAPISKPLTPEQEKENEEIIK